MSESDRQPTPAEAYEDYFLPAIFEPLTDLVLDRSRPASGHHVLDVACGTGVVARRVAPLVGTAGRVVGIDLNPGMVEVARRRARDVPGAAIEYRVGDAESLEVPDETCDWVVCQQGLQFVPDRAAAVREMARVLRPGGQVVIATWQGLDRHPLYTAMAEVEAPHLASFGLPVTLDDLAAPFSMGDPDELRELLGSAGLGVVDVTAGTVEARFATPDRFVERMEYAYAAVVPAFAKDPDQFAAYLERITRETKDLVDEYRIGDHVVVPMHTHVAVAHG